MKRIAAGAAAAVCLCLLLVFPALALEGARQGLTLWAGVVLPTLLPFMFCSGAVVSLGAMRLLTCPFERPLNWLLGLSPEESYIFLCGLLCGCPMGAKTSCEFLLAGRISPSQSRVLTAISNHPSPMFLLGYVLPLLTKAFADGTAGHTLTRPERLPLLFLTSVYLPILPLSLLARRLYRPQPPALSVSGSSKAQPGARFPAFDAQLLTSLETMEKIGLYIMLFSILSLFLRSLPLPLPVPLRLALLGTVEITTGIRTLADGFSGSAALLLITACTAFGGFCALFQTRSVLCPAQKSAGLPIRHYLLWKLLHSLLSVLFLIVLYRFSGSS